MLWIFDVTAPSVAELRDRLAEGVGKPMGCCVVLDGEIATGEWPVIAHREVSNAEALAALEHERGESSSGRTVLALAMRYAGLWAWDFGNPEYAEKHLLPGVVPPPDRPLDELPVVEGVGDGRDGHLRHERPPCERPP